MQLTSLNIISSFWWGSYYKTTDREIVISSIEKQGIQELLKFKKPLKEFTVLNKQYQNFTICSICKCFCGSTLQKYVYRKWQMAKCPKFWKVNTLKPETSQLKQKNAQCQIKTSALYQKIQLLQNATLSKPGISVVDCSLVLVYLKRIGSRNGLENMIWKILQAITKQLNNFLSKISRQFCTFILQKKSFKQNV